MLGVRVLFLIAALVNPVVNGYRGDEDQDARLMDLLRRFLDLQTEKAEDRLATRLSSSSIDLQDTSEGARICNDLWAGKFSWAVLKISDDQTKLEVVSTAIGTHDDLKQMLRDTMEPRYVFFSAPKEWEEAYRKGLIVWQPSSASLITRMHYNSAGKFVKDSCSRAVRLLGVQPGTIDSIREAMKL